MQVFENAKRLSSRYVASLIAERHSLISGSVFAPLSSHCSAATSERREQMTRKESIGTASMAVRERERVREREERCEVDAWRQEARVDSSMSRRFSLRHGVSCFPLL